MGAPVSPRPINPQPIPCHARLYFLRRASLCGQATSPDHHSALLLLNIPAISVTLVVCSSRQDKAFAHRQMGSCLNPVKRRNAGFVLQAIARIAPFSLFNVLLLQCWAVESLGTVSSGSISVPLPKSLATGISRLSLSQPCHSTTSTSPPSSSVVLFVKQRTLYNQWILHRYGLRQCHCLGWGTRCMMR